MRFVWNTGARRSGRLVRGSTFLVPVIRSTFDGPGHVDDAARTALQTAATNLVTAAGANLRILSRPGVRVTTGGSAAIISATVPDKVSWLRSRRT